MKIKTILTALFGVIVLTGCANKSGTKQASERNDTLEGFNRTMWKFNYNVMDRYVLEPAAKGWNNYVPNQRGFGETLGSYGVDAGTYIVLPIYNATTPRQLTGAVVDAAYMYPFWEWVGGPWSLVKYGVQAVDARAKNIDNAELLRQAQDPYVTFREAYYQNLQFKVSDGKSTENKESLSDDVLKEID